MKLELVLTRWKDGLFKSRDKIEADDFDSLEEQFDKMIEINKEKILEEQNKRLFGHDIDDDIPF